MTIPLIGTTKHQNKDLHQRTRPYKHIPCAVPTHESPVQYALQKFRLSHVPVQILECLHQDWPDADQRDPKEGRQPVRQDVVLHTAQTIDENHVLSRLDELDLMVPSFL